ncbi:MAG: cyanoglobin [Polyangiales bacterium]
MESPFHQLGGEEVVRGIVERFYDAMERDAPELARLHERDADGRVSRDARDRFALFLIGWLGGPQTYMERHGHPRLRMRHQRITIDVPLRDAWMRSMMSALDASKIDASLRAFLETRLGEVAEMLRATSTP